VRVVIAVDSALLRDGLVRLLQTASIDVMEVVADVDALPQAVDKHRPDLVLINVHKRSEHGDEGLRAALGLRLRWAKLAILVLSQHVEERYVVELPTGEWHAIGYLLGDRATDVRDFLDTLYRVAGGGTALDPDVVSQLLVRRSGDVLDGLTARQRQVLALMAQGQTNAGIATALRVSDSAVTRHIGAIVDKLELPSGGDQHRRARVVLRFLAA
jgi:DNA-binding NarL/FixJ family response regulator